MVATTDSVVSKVDATLVAFCNALLVTFAGSRIPAAAMRESFTMLAGAVRQSSVSASMQNGNRINVDNVRMNSANMFAEAVIRIREGYITVEQLMRVGISDRAIAVQALVAMGVEVKE